MVRTVLGYVLEVIGVLILALGMVLLFGWAWGLIPVGVYVIITGVIVGSNRQ